MKQVKASSVENVLLVVMCATVALQIAAYERVRHLILCGIVIILCITLLILDRISGNKKSVVTHGIWTLIWGFNFVINLLLN